MKTEAIFDNIAEHLEEQIDLAENKIVVAVAWFTNKRLFDALCAKAADGVKVKLIISDNEINRNSNIDYSDIQIGKSKLHLIDEEKMHNKFCIIDDYKVITGSYNWSYRAESNFENILICSGDNDLVKQYKSEVKKIIKDYSPENDIKPKSRWEEAIKSGRIEPFVPPGLKLRDYNTPTEKLSTKKDFESIKLGKQEWMLKNLDVDRFRNGDLIPHIKDKEEWMKAGKNKQPAWCYYDNNSENGKIYGKLYNWYAVNDKRGLAPVGWLVPRNEEWIKLEDYIGGKTIAGVKMRLVGTAYWYPPNDGITDDFSFSALPGGLRNINGSFGFFRKSAFFWSAEIRSKYDWLRYLNGNDSDVKRISTSKSVGGSVRCLRD